MSFAAVTPERFLVASLNGMIEITPAGTSTLYDNSVLRTSACFAPNLTALPDVFLYNSGCTGRPLLGGKLDGSGISEVYDPPVYDVMGLGKFTAGSVVINEENRVTVFTVATALSTVVRLNPEISTVAVAAELTSGSFYGFDVAAGPQGELYFVGTASTGSTGEQDRISWESHVRSVRTRTPSLSGNGFKPTITEPIRHAGVEVRETIARSGVKKQASGQCVECLKAINNERKNTNNVPKWSEMVDCG